MPAESTYHRPSESIPAPLDSYDHGPSEAERLQSSMLMQPSHPMDTSRLLLGLLSLAQEADAGDPNEHHDDSLDGVVARETLRTLLGALHFRDASTVHHARQVALLSVGMAESLQWEARHLRVLEVAALLHDIGKIGVPDNVLFKPGKLSPDEIDLMALHHRIGIDVLQACRVDHEVLEIVAQSQDHYNGAADGFRRIGSEVHQGARILAVADAYDSLTTDQVFREGMSHERAMMILKESAGTRFDGNVIRHLTGWLERNGEEYRQRAEENRRASSMPQTLTGIEEILEATALGNIFSYLYLLESLYDGFFLVDADLRFKVWNQSCEDLLGHPTRQILGERWNTDRLPHADQFGEQQLNETNCPLYQVMKSGRAQTDLIQIQTGGGRWLPFEVQSVPLVDQSGNLHGVAQILRNLANQSRKNQSYRDLTLAASRDPLTQIANRGALETRLMSLFSEYSQRTDPESFGVIFIDVDHFKGINDNYGHDVGDDVLVAVARTLQHDTYSGELVGRYGGEEFMIVCPDCDLEAIHRRAERLRATLSSTEVDPTHDLKVTASFGVSCIEPGDSVASLVRRADRGVYLSKAKGRNQTHALTGLQFDEIEKELSTPEKKARDPYLLESKFEAFLASNMLSVKLGGFVDDFDGRLGKVTDERVEIKLGQVPFFRRWGKTEDRQPVSLVVEFIRDQRGRDPKMTRAAAQAIRVKVSIRPLGRVREIALFEDRARAVLRALKSYFQVGI